MAWPLLLIGAGLAVCLILLRAPSVMLIAVGIYLPFETTFAIFVGGLIKALYDRMVAKKSLPEPDRVKLENRGILLASGLIAGEALTGVLLASLVIMDISLPRFGDSPLLGLVIFPVIGITLIAIPLRSLMKEKARG